ncbi:MAG TPA: hypothetical protein VH062_10220 [Polyangiaceae bacterium]|jgi:hypothetical protein|nr:hypothetical protein [Polyangiaceae bacterium]
MTVEKNGRKFWLKTSSQRVEVHDVTDPSKKKILYSSPADSRRRSEQMAKTYIDNLACS